jgi:methylphosphotriester-DNA--protein-cysteine methyltransferase
MIRHTELADNPFKRGRQLKALLSNSKIAFAGNQKLKIYGTLSCSSGKRMKMENRVFFVDAAEAVALGYRPCGHCMRNAYQQWKTQAN